MTRPTFWALIGLALVIPFAAVWLGEALWPFMGTH